MKRVAIVGLGLMGGSLGLALKRHGFRGMVVGCARRPEARMQALRQRVVDEVWVHPHEAVQEADLVVYCAPVLAIPDLVRACRGNLQPGCLVTDVGSTKASLAEQLPPLLAGSGAHFIGSHPIAGSEQQGLPAARADLYEQAVVVLTPDAQTPPEAVAALQAFWTQTGAVVRQMSPAEHDRMMARTSHAPHLIAALLAQAVGRDGALEQTGAYCGSGFRDTTRIADGSPEVWHDILASNAGAIAGELEAFRALLDQAVTALQGGRFEELKTLLTESRDRRRRLLAARAHPAGQGES